MKRTIATIVSGSLVLSGVAISFASALEVGGGADLHVGAQMNARQDDEHRGDAQMNASSEVGASSTLKVEDSNGGEDQEYKKNNSSGDEYGKKPEKPEMKDNHEEATSSEDNQDEVTPEEHRSKVAEFVKSLLEVANHDREIGDEVRVVAQTEDDSASTTADAMDEVDSRSPILTFLIGSDYKNLGVIRSEIATTQNSIDQLKKVVDKTTDVTTKAEITAQVTALQDSNTKLDAYVQAHEQVFSLFGWFVKLLGSK